ncbi:hypothetical protein B0J14DRAFT_606812 [Halenospora varia]|nr:hypothetical protein B0J14DRAFT_606812 [Halenospora varia]
MRIPNILYLGLIIAFPSLIAAHYSYGSPAWHSSPQEQIRYTLAAETFILDLKNWTALHSIYTPDAVADFSALGAGVWTGIDEIIANEKKALGAYVGIHQITSCMIDVHDDGTADVTSYYMFNHFGGEGKQPGYVWQAWAKYHDSMVGTEDGYRVKKRSVQVIGGPLEGNFTKVVGG